MVDKEFWNSIASQWVKEVPQIGPVEKIEIPKDDNASLLDYLSSIDWDDI